MLQMSAPTKNPLSTKITLATYNFKYLPQTANCQHRIQKVMSCCLRSFVVTMTLFRKNNFTLSPKSVLSSLGRNWTGRVTEGSSYYSQTCFICAAARNCVLSGLSIWHVFEAPLSDPKLTIALNSLLLKKKRPETMFWPWDLLAWPCSCLKIVKSSLPFTPKGKGC